MAAAQRAMFTRPVDAVPTGAASLMHQTNANGQALTRATPTTISTKPRSGADVFLRILCCFPGVTSEPTGPIGRGGPLLPTIESQDYGKQCLVLDLDETLVHSSFKPIPNPDFVIPVEIDGTVHHVYVLKRPGVDDFLLRIGKLFEVVVFTASLAKYADPLLDLLDMHKVVRHRLFRESCTCHEGNYVKDLTILGRRIESTIIVDNSPMSYLFQPENAIGVSSFVDDPSDRELYYCLPFLESIVKHDNVIEHLHQYPSFIVDEARRQTGLGGA